MRLHLDFETRSRCPIREAGTVRYCFDETTEPVMVAIAKDDEEPYLWSPPRLREITGHDEESEELIERLGRLEDGDTVHAFNYMFEHCILLKKFDIEVPIKHWRCTQILGRIAGYPESLKDLCKQLGFEDGKIEAGHALLNYFCSPISSGGKKGEFREPDVDPLRWWELGEYCKHDVRVERECYHLLKEFWPKGPAKRAFMLTHVMNMRGAPINVPAMKHAQGQLDRATAHYGEEFERVVGFKPTQRDRCLEWFQSQGYPYESLDQEHIKLVMEDENRSDIVSDEVADLLKLRSETTPAAVKKLKKMDRMLCEDGTVKGAMTFYGAQQTGRWSSTGLQLQNMKRPGESAIDFFKMIQDGMTWEEIEVMLGCSYIEALSYSIRCFIGTFPGLCIADYSSIEARLTAWLAGQKDIVDAFASGRKIYEMMAAHIFGMEEDEVEKDSFERHIGKSAVLGAGFGLGAEGFARNAGCSIEIAQQAIDGYRDSNDQIVALWYRLARASMRAVKNPGKVIQVNTGDLPTISYWYGTMHNRMDGGEAKYLVCTLPSGRHVYYLRPEIRDKKMPWGDMKESLRYLSRDPKTGKMWIKWLWHGALIENAIQAIAADLMMFGAVNAWKAGFDVRMLVHDETVAKRGGAKMHLDHHLLVKEMTKLPSWAKGLPLGADGKDVPFFSK